MILTYDTEREAKDKIDEIDEDAFVEYDALPIAVNGQCLWAIRTYTITFPREWGGRSERVFGGWLTSEDSV